MKYGSVCSGIEAATVAWHPLGWTPAWFAEIEPFPSAVLAHHYPEVPNYGDFTHIRDNDHPADRGIDLLVGGTPCFPAGVRVATAEGFKPIEAVCAGDSVLTHTGRFQPVLRVGCKPATTVMVKGQGHPGVVTTPEHPFYARRKSRYSTRVEGKAITVKSVSQPSWVKAEDLPGSHWACVAHWPEMPVPQVECVGRETNGVDLTPALFVLAGAYLGDGWVRINERKGYVLLGVNEAKLEKLRPYLAQVGVYQVAEMRTSCRVSLASRPLARWLSEHFGSGADGKSIPMWALGMREDLRRALLFGYQLTDGHTDKKGVGKITTVSKQLALTTRMLANSLGYASSVQFCARPATHMIEGRVVNQRDTYVVSISQSTRSSFEAQGYRWQCVRSVAPTGRNEIVYNLEVEGDNSYVVDGIAVHNCQAFSIAGLRGGLDDDRGQLALEFMRLVGALRPRWVLWENVPGVLSSNGGRDFGSILGALAELGYGFAWRVLDAQHFGVPQRRRRVFLVGHSGGDSRRPAAVLFEPEGLHGNPPSREGARQDTSGSSGDGPARCVTAGEMKRLDWETRSFVASGGRSMPVTPESPTDLNAVESQAFDPYNLSVTNLAATLGINAGMSTGRNGVVQPIPLDLCNVGRDPEKKDKQNRQGLGVATAAVAFAQNQLGEVRCGEVLNTLNTNSNASGRNTPMIQSAMAVRRLTPVECSRLQGFPDTYLETRYADANEAHAAQVLHSLWREAGTPPVEGQEWRTGISAALLTPQVLLAGVYGGWLSWPLSARCAASRGALPGENFSSEEFVRELRKNAELGRSPYQRESFGQLALQLGCSVSELPLEGTQAGAVLRSSRLWPEAQRTWPLRYALATRSQVEKGRVSPDGPRYKALGNSMAVPVMRWIGQRIEMVDKL